MERSDDDDQDPCVYATLTCRRPAAGGGGTTRVYVGARFHDGPSAAVDGQVAVLRVRAAVASDVYAGRVTVRQAVGGARSATAAHGDAVAGWLRHARHALAARRDDDGGGDGDGADYEHWLEEERDGRPAVVLTWKQKLRPFGTVARGSVRLCRRAAVGGGGGEAAADPVCGLFVEPLIRRLAAERLRGERAERAAADDARRLLADNGRLLDELRSAADRRRLDDDRLIARFVAVLNAKKARLAAALREVSDLREELRLRGDVPAAAVGPAEASASAGGRRGRGSKGVRQRPAPDFGRAAVAKRGRRRLSIDVVGGTADGAEGTAERADVPAAEDDAADDRQLEPMETDDRGTAVTERVVVPDAASAPDGGTVAEVDVFEADTQIDDDSESSPPWFQRVGSTPLPSTDEPPLPSTDEPPLPSTDEPPSPSTDEPPSDKVMVNHQEKSFLDDLWRGIL